MTVHEVFTYLCVDDADAALAFYCKAFGAREKLRLAEPSGKIGHAEIELAGTTLMIADEFPEMGVRGPKALGGTPVAVHLHVDDADAFMARAVEAGATVMQEASDQFYGERSGRIRDPFGHEWLVGHSIEDVSPEEMQRRYTALFS